MSRRAFGSTAALIAVLSVATLAPVMAATPAGAAACGQSSSTGHVTIPVTSDGRVREVKLFIPGAYNGRRAIPLLFDLHGSSGSGAGQAANSDMATTAEKHGFAVAWPDGGITLPGAPDAHYWNITGLPLTGNTPAPADAPDEAKFFSDAIDQIATRFCIDLQRVYVAGHSGGGRMSSLLGCQLADRIAAIAPVVGLRAGIPSQPDPSRPDPASCKPSRAMPVITFHGTDDKTNPYAGGGNLYWQYGVEAAVKRWVEIDGCRATPTVEKITEHVQRLRYTGCRDGAVVEFNRIDAPGALGGGHTWPGSPQRRDPAPGAAPSYPSREISASERIWEFVSQYHL